MVSVGTALSELDVGKFQIVLAARLSLVHMVIHASMIMVLTGHLPAQYIGLVLFLILSKIRNENSKALLLLVWLTCWPWTCVSLVGAESDSCILNNCFGPPPVVGSEVII